MGIFLGGSYFKSLEYSKNGTGEAWVEEEVRGGFSEANSGRVGGGNEPRYPLMRGRLLLGRAKGGGWGMNA